MKVKREVEQVAEKIAKKFFNEKALESGKISKVFIFRYLNDLKNEEINERELETLNEFIGELKLELEEDYNLVFDIKTILEIREKLIQNLINQEIIQNISAKEKIQKYLFFVSIGGESEYEVQKLYPKGWRLIMDYLIAEKFDYNYNLAYKQLLEFLQVLD